MPQSHTLLLPRQKKSGVAAIAITHGINGVPQANLWEQGEGGADTVLNAISPPVYRGRRRAAMFNTANNVLLVGSIAEIATLADNTAKYITLRRATDGKTFGAESIIATSPSPGSSGYAVGNPQFNQRGANVYCMFITLPYGGFVGETSATCDLLWTDSSDDGETWNGTPTDITAKLIPAGNGGSETFGICATNTFGDGPEVYTITAIATDPGLSGKVQITLSASAPDWTAGWMVRLSGTGTALDGTNWYLDAGSNSSHWLLRGSNWQAGYASAAGKASPVATTIITGVGQGVTAPNGSTIFFAYYTYDVNGSGRRYPVNLITSDFTNWTTSQTHESAYPASSSFIEQQGCVCGSNIVIYHREADAGGYVWLSISSDNGQTIGVPFKATFTDGSTHLFANSVNSGIVCTGGNNLVLIAQEYKQIDLAHRSHLSAFYSTNGNTATPTWTFGATIHPSGAGYNSACIRKGLICVGYEKAQPDDDVNIAGVLSWARSIGFATFNLAWLQSTPLPEIRYTFTELPATTATLIAWTGASQFLDSGGGDHRAAVVGSPLYSVVGDVNSIQFGNTSSDAALLSGVNDNAFDPDYYPEDTGAFWWEIEGVFSSFYSGGAIIGAAPTITHASTGTDAGYTCELLSTGYAAITVCDGTNHATVVSPQTINSGSLSKVILARSKTGGQILAYDGTNLATAPNTASDPTGVLANATIARYLGQFSDGTGNFKGSLPTLVRFVKGEFKPSLALPFPYATNPTRVPGPAAQPSTAAGAPNNVAANLAFWGFDRRGGWACRSNNNCNPPPAPTPLGWGMQSMIDNAAGYFGASGALGAVYVNDAVLGNCWDCGITNASLTMDGRTIGAFPYLAKMSGPWTIAWFFNAPNGPDAGALFNNWDGTNGFILGSVSAGSSGRWSVTIGAGGTYFECLVFTSDNSNAYRNGTPYLAVLSFNGTGGSGAAGLTFWQQPNPSISTTLADVQTAGYKSTNLNSGVSSGSTNTTGSTDSTAPLKFGASSSALGMVLGDVCIWQTAFTDSEVLALCNYVPPQN